MRRIDYNGQEYLIHTRSGMRLVDVMQEMGVPVVCNLKNPAENVEACMVKFEKAQLFLLTPPTALEKELLGAKLNDGFRLVGETLFK